MYGEAVLMKKTETEIDANGVIEKAAKLLAGAKTVYLATNGSHGHPNLRALSPVTVEGVRTVWFATDAVSNKVQELQNDKHAVIYVDAPRAACECRLWGFVEILDDMESREKIWNEEVAKHCPDGIESPDLRVLRFDVVNGRYTDNKKMETFPFNIE